MNKLPTPISRLGHLIMLLKYLMSFIFYFMISYGYTQFSSLYKMVLGMFRLLYLCAGINDFQILTI